MNTKLPAKSVFTLTRTLDGLINPALITQSPADAKILVLGGQRLELDRFPSLSGIFKVGVGVENLELELLGSKGIQLGCPSARTRELIYKETSAFSAKLILESLFVNLGDNSSWKKAARQALDSKSVVIVGQGNIGSRVNLLLQPFTNVYTYDAAEDSSEKLMGLLPLADALSLHIPGGGENSGFLNWQMLKNMRPGAAVVNTSRGDLISETNILRGITELGLRFFCDVLPVEPYSGQLQQFYGEGLQVTPHVAGYTEQYLASLYDDFIAFLEIQYSSLSPTPRQPDLL